MYAVRGLRTKNWKYCPYITLFCRVTLDLVVVLIFSVFQCCLQDSDKVTNRGFWRQMKIHIQCVQIVFQKKTNHENNTRFSIPGKFLTNWDLGMICSIEKPFSCNPRLCRLRPGFVDSNFKLNNIHISTTLNIEFGNFDTSKMA